MSEILMKIIRYFYREPFCQYTLEHEIYNSPQPNAEKDVSMTPPNDAPMPDEIWAYPGEENWPAVWNTGDSLAGDAGVKYIRADLVPASSAKKIEGLDRAIQDIEAITDLAADRTHETGMRTTVNGITPLAMERVLEAARAYRLQENQGRT